MKSTTLMAVAVGLAMILAAGPASAFCVTYLTVFNKSADPINLYSCATKKKGGKRWHGTVYCAGMAANSNNLGIDPGGNRRVRIETSRKKNTQFEIKLAYKVNGQISPVGAVSNMATCAQTHQVTVR